MKKVIRISIALIALTALLFCCISCKRTDKDGYKDPNRKQTEYLIYTSLFGEVSIVGTTAVGVNQDYLIIPDEIDGLPVTYVDYLTTHKWSEEQGVYTHYIKKLYVAPNVHIFDYHHKIDYTEELKIIFWGEDPPKMHRIRCSTSEYLYDIYDEKYPLCVNIANISYVLNYDNAPNKSVHFVDDLEEGERVVVFPSEPIRDGYAFTGWYSEAECINKVELETFIYKKDMSNVTFYAGWQEKLH